MNHPSYRGNLICGWMRFSSVILFQENPIWKKVKAQKKSKWESGGVCACVHERTCCWEGRKEKAERKKTEWEADIEETAKRWGSVAGVTKTNKKAKKKEEMKRQGTSWERSGTGRSHRLCLCPFPQAQALIWKDSQKWNLSINLVLLQIWWCASTKWWVPIRSLHLSNST